MNKWPTISKLSEASLEEVHKVWSGLGYYSRATRLLEGAKKIQEANQHLPQTATELQAILPGIGGLKGGGGSDKHAPTHIPNSE